MQESSVEINIIVSKEGVEKVKIFGGFKHSKEGLGLYNLISDEVKSIDRIIKSEAKNESPRN